MEKAPLLSAVIANEFVQHDMDTTAFGDPHGFLNGLGKVKISADSALMKRISAACEDLSVPFTYGLIATGDHFIADEKQKETVINRFGALLIDMETAAFAEVCDVYQKPFACLRIVSDAVDHNAEYRKYKPIAGKKACEVGLRILKQ